MIDGFAHHSTGLEWNVFGISRDNFYSCLARLVPELLVCNCLILTTQDGWYFAYANLYVSQELTGGNGGTLSVIIPHLSFLFAGNPDIFGSEVSSSHNLYQHGL